MLDTVTIADPAQLEPLYEEWDDLAVRCALPLMAPALVLAWWRHLAPADAQARAVAVREQGRLVGLAPFYVVPGPGRRLDFRLPGIELGTRLAPLAAPNREWEVAGAIAGALADCVPRPDLLALESVPPSSPWLTALREQWPGRMRPLHCLYHLHGSPTIALEGSFEDWLAARSASFRKNRRRRGRMLAEAHGAMRLGTPETLKRDVETLLRLHADRWRARGGSSLVAQGERLRAMLLDAGARLAPSGRLRIWVLEIDGAPAWANLFLSAGGELLAVNSGWDERWRRLSPPSLGMLRAIEDAFERGERRLDLGVGDDPYKLEFADGNDPVGWGILVPPGWRMPLTALRVAPMLLASALRGRVKRTLTETQLERLRALRRRLRR